MSKQPRVAVEDRFTPATCAVTGRSTAIIWRVVDLFEGRDGIAYARVVNHADPSLAKTLAAQALLDRSLFLHAE
jgi:hypothetical protein